MNKHEYWEKLYKTKLPGEVSWTQEHPEASLAFIRSLNLPKTASIIDVGGGAGNLADHLLEEGFENITVLDISETALENAKKRLGSRAKKITWIVTDITSFKPTGTYDVWHDRATFHFLTSEEQVQQYLTIAARAVTGFLIIGTFSLEGPETCSGLPVHQYSAASLEATVKDKFNKIHCFTEDHVTPFQTKQEFLFCSFKRKSH